ncbi:hypothetical protein BH11BAC2_BH11BAC2_26650 [soil metagenome]
MKSFTNYFVHPSSSSNTFRISKMILFVNLLILTFQSKGQAPLIHYYGSVHSHSQYSDGNMGNSLAYLNVKSCFQYVKNSQHINFWGISDHNHSQAGMLVANFRKGVLEADSVNQNGIFPTMYGIEFGTISAGGHLVFYGIDSLVGWETGNYDIFNGQTDYAGLFQKIASRGDHAFCILAHMNSTDYGNIIGSPYNAITDSAISGIAMRNGPAFSTDTVYGNPSTSTFFARFQDLLKKGYHLAPTIDQDCHYINFGRGQEGRTIVISDSLTRSALYRAFHNRRFYASDDWNIQVNFSVNGNIMGSIANGTTNPGITVSITDPDGETASSIKIWYGIPGNGVASTALTSNTLNNSLSFTHTIAVGSTYYYFAEITQPDGDKIWTAPVWYTHQNTPLPIELLSFDVKKINNKALASWTTATEFNTDRFEIEKSINGIDFKSIGSVPAEGGQNELTSYSFQDDVPLQELTYYRLVDYDFDGSFHYSNIRVLYPDHQDNSLVIYPNPASGDEIQIAIASSKEEESIIEIFNTKGQLMISADIFTTKGILYLPINIAELSSGLYLIRMVDKSGSASKSYRFIRN